jgi:hypothetical protein
VYTERSLLDSWNPERQLYWNPESSYLSETGVLSPRIGAQTGKHWNPERQSFHTERFLLAVDMGGLYYWYRYNVS